jgi:recombination protein RecA
LLGDGSLRWESAERGHLRFGHCKEQAAYCEWKAQNMNCVMSTMKNDVVWAETARCEEFQLYRDLQIKKHRTSIPQKYIDMLTVKAVAIWYMDDGTFKGQSTKYWGNGGCQICSSKLDFETLSKIALKLEDLGLGKATVTYGKGLRWYGKESGKFQQGIAQHIHPNIRYKIKAGLPEFNWTVDKCEPSLMIVESVVVSTNPTKILGDRNRHRYDLTIEDCHSYIVDGVIVHNSFGETKTRTGGRAMDFYASQILWLAQLKRLDRTIRKQKRVYGIQVKAQCKKNKIGLPFREAEFPILFGYGMDEAEAMLAWLESIDFDISIWNEYKDGRSSIAQSIKMLDIDKRNKVLQQIREHVAVNWEEIETRFLPTVRKY